MLVELIATLHALGFQILTMVATIVAIPLALAWLFVRQWNKQM